MLCEKFTAANISVKRSDKDPDVSMIVTTMKRFNRTYTIIVVCKGVHPLILLTIRIPIDNQSKQMIIYSPKPERAQVQTRIHLSESSSANFSQNKQ